jgi:hypothetical protein
MRLTLHEDRMIGTLSVGLGRESGILDVRFGTLSNHSRILGDGVTCVIIGLSLWQCR